VLWPKQVIVERQDLSRAVYWNCNTPDCVPHDHDSWLCIQGAEYAKAECARKINDGYCPTSPGQDSRDDRRCSGHRKPLRCRQKLGHVLCAYKNPGTPQANRNYSGLQARL